MVDGFFFCLFYLSLSLSLFVIFEILRHWKEGERGVEKSRMMLLCVKLSTTRIFSRCSIDSINRSSMLEDLGVSC